MAIVFIQGESLSGFDPRPYIEGLLADLDLPLSYEQVYEAYMLDPRKGLTTEPLPRHNYLCRLVHFFGLF